MSEEDDNMMEYKTQSDFFFKERVEQASDRPNPNRGCTDAWCIAFFFIITGSFLGYCIYCIHQVYTMQMYSMDLSNARIFSFLSLQHIQVALAYMAGMLGITLLLASVLVLLLRYVVKAAYIIMLITTFAGMGALIGICFYYGITSFGIVLAVMTFILFIIWCCLRQQLQSMTVIMQTVAIFISARPLIFAVAFGCQLFSILASMLWIAGFYSIITFYNQYILGSEGLIALTVFWIFCGFFYFFFFYYTMSYLIGAETAIWFYKANAYSIATPFKWLFRHGLGAISLASILLALIKTARILVMLARSSRKAKGMAALILCIVACVLSCFLRHIEYYTKILNNYAMIICALTGMGYIDSAKTAACMIFNNIEAYNTFTAISYFIRLGGLFTCTFVPTIVSYYLFMSIPLPLELVYICMGIVFFFSLVISLVLFQTIIESMDAMFVFYSLQAQMGQFGQRVQNIIEEADRIQEYYNQGLKEYVKMKRPQQQIEVINGGQKTTIIDGKIVKVEQTHGVAMEAAKYPGPMHINNNPGFSQTALNINP